MIPRFWKKSPQSVQPLGPVVIYHHIAKTGGTSLRKVVQANYKGKALLELYGPHRNSVAWYEQYYHSLPPARKAAIQCIAAHSAHYIIPVLDRPFRVFTLLRDPVDRVISLYYFTQRLAQKGRGKGADMGRLLAMRGWRLEDIYLHAARGDINESQEPLLAPFFNGQTRAILGPHTDTSIIPFLPGIEPPLDAPLRQALDILDRYYELGITEAYADSVHHFARVFGWQRVFVTHANRTRKRPPVHAFPSEILDLIRAYNQLDTVLHAYARRYLNRHLTSPLENTNA